MLHQAEDVSVGCRRVMMFRNWWLLVAITLVAFNLRPAITSVAAVLEELRSVLGLDPRAIPLLVALPVLAFGLSAPCGPWLARRVGPGRAIAVAMLVLAAALSVRVLGPVVMLPGTFLAGVAIMAASVLVPQVLRANRGTAWSTGLWTMGIGLGAALGAGLTQPLQHLFGGSVTWALAVWAIPALVGALLIQWHGEPGPSPTGAGGMSPLTLAESEDPQEAGGVPRNNCIGILAPLPLRKQTTAWAVTAFFGLQAMLYFSLTSSLAAFLIYKGMTPLAAAAFLGWFNVAGLPAGLLAPVLAGRRNLLAFMSSGLGILMAAVLLTMLAAPGDLQFVLVGLLGVAQGAGFGVAMTLIVIRSAGPLTAGKLSAMSQGIGFVLAAMGPIGAALLLEWTQRWEATIWALAAEAILLAVAGHLAVKGRLISVEVSDESLPGPSRASSARSGPG